MAQTNTKVATIRGTLLKVGVSKNKRLYTAENIRSAAESAKSDLAAGKTLNMYTTHDAAAKDDPMSLVGKFTKVWQETDGSLKFEADVPNTTTGRDYANLTDGGFQRTISIRGGWGSTPTIEDYDGQKVLTAPTLRLGGADGTASPGVEGASIEGIDFLESFVESDGNFNPEVFMAITESVDIEIEPFTEEVKPEISEDVMEKVFELLADVMEADDSKKPYGNVTYADPGYQADKKKRYPLDSEQHVKAAWSYINVAKNASKYSSAQLSRIKGKIKSAAKKYGINISEWYEDFVAGILESLEVAGLNEMYASMTVSNGDGSVTTNGYANDGADLLKVAHRIALAAIMGMYFIDPDQDGDIDSMDPAATTAPSKPSESTASNDKINEAEQQTSCPACGNSVSAYVPTCPYCFGPISQVESADNTEATTNKETTSMSETNIPAGTADTAPANEPAPVVAATEAAPSAPAIDYKALAEEMLKQQKESADAAQAEADRVAAEEAAKPKTFSEEEVAALVAATKESVTSEATAAALEEARRAGDIKRAGYTTEAAKSYYEAIQESDEAQSTFLGKLSTSDLQAAMSAVLSDDRNLAGTAPKLAANVR
jgi:hypothetical protein